MRSNLDRDTVDSLLSEEYIAETLGFDMDAPETHKEFVLHSIAELAESGLGVLHHLRDVGLEVGGGAGLVVGAELDQHPVAGRHQALHHRPFGAVGQEAGGALAAVGVVGNAGGGSKVFRQHLPPSRVVGVALIAGGRVARDGGRFHEPDGGRGSLRRGPRARAGPGVVREPPRAAGATRHDHGRARPPLRCGLAVLA